MTNDTTNADSKWLREQTIIANVNLSEKTGTANGEFEIGKCTWNSKPRCKSNFKRTRARDFTNGILKRQLRGTVNGNCKGYSQRKIARTLERKMKVYFKWELNLDMV